MAGDMARGTPGGMAGDMARGTPGGMAGGMAGGLDMSCSCVGLRVRGEVEPSLKASSSSSSSPNT